MRFRDAKKLDNRDGVLIRASHGKWEYGYVLGSPKIEGKTVFIPVQSPTDGLHTVTHQDVR
jgi:hypothetical protein